MSGDSPLDPHIYPPNESKGHVFWMCWESGRKCFVVVVVVGWGFFLGGVVREEIGSYQWEGLEGFYQS